MAPTKIRAGGNLFRRWAILGALVCVGLLSGCAGEQRETAEAIAAETVAAMKTVPPGAGRRPPEADWREHFDSLEHGAILISLDRKFLSYWEPDNKGYHVFPIAVPLTEELRRTGKTKIVRKRENPDWRPTPAMRERNPDLPEYIGPGPHNPLGERALYLGWQYYAIHGTNDARAIGTQATSGCIRLMPDDILWLYERATLGTPVKILDDFATDAPRRRHSAAAAR